MSLFSELKRRNVFRVAAAYAAVAWLLIQVAETVFPLFGFDDSPARVMVIVLAIAFIPAMIFTWAFQLTPEGLKRDRDIDRTQPAPPGSGRQLDRMIMLALALALGYFAFDKFVLDPRRESARREQAAAQVEAARQAGRSEALIESYGDKSIAVLAFDDMSPNGDQEYLSDGIAEELLNLLARIPELRVISRSSAFSYKGRDINLAKVARELNVAHILEGSVRKSGNQVRITVQLIDARTDTHLWSRTYDRTLDDLFAVQDEIAAAVVKQLKLTLLGEIPTIEETDPAAYALLLQARHLGRQGTAEGYAQSIALYQQALAILADYPAAWDGLAANYINQANKSLRPLDEGYALARAAAERALAIDPDYAAAHARLGWIAMIYDNDLPLAARRLQQALALEPSNPGIVGNAAALLFTLGRLQDSVALDEYSSAHDPVSPTGYANLGRSYLAVGRWDEAIAAYQTALRLSPDRIAVHYFIGVALLLQGEAEAALASMRQEGFELLRLLGLALAYHTLGDADAADAALEELIAGYEHDAAYNIAQVLAWRNEADRAFEWLGKAKAYGDPGLADIVAEPLFGKLHADPRWLPFLESLGKAPWQLDAIPFEAGYDGAGAAALWLYLPGLVYWQHPKRWALSMAATRASC
ncbi:MAG: tetratricopeptide repeat protein [Xanthomonadales bacterium]|nr:tetratricopeptide repeat protein [Xanthomonadales bacterium]